MFKFILYSSKRKLFKKNFLGCSVNVVEILNKNMTKPLNKRRKVLCIKVINQQKIMHYKKVIIKVINVTLHSKYELI